MNDSNPELDGLRVMQVVASRIPTAHGEFQLHLFQNNQDDKDHLAFVLGDVGNGENILTRVHSECFTGDVLGSQRCDCGEQLEQALDRIAREGCGILLYMRQEGRGIGLLEKLRAYNLQDEGYDTVDANLLLGHQADSRNYSISAAMLNSLSVRSVRLLTNNPTKIDELTSLGIRVAARVPLATPINANNARYLRTKVTRMNHLLDLPIFREETDEPDADRD